MRKQPTERNNLRLNFLIKVTNSFQQWLKGVFDISREHLITSLPVDNHVIHAEGITETNNIFDAFEVSVPKTRQSNLHCSTVQFSYLELCVQASNFHWTNWAQSQKFHEKRKLLTKTYPSTSKTPSSNSFIRMSAVGGLFFFSTF